MNSLGYIENVNLQLHTAKIVLKIEITTFFMFFLTKNVIFCLGK